MRRSILPLIILTIILTSCGPNAMTTTAEKPNASAPYPDLGPAPELANEIWLNTSESLRLADLRGKVVLIDMWTFG